MRCVGKREISHCCRRFIPLLALSLVSLVLLCLTPGGAYAYDTPAGYDEHDYQKLVAFLEYSDGTKKNGEKINAGYNPEDPATWTGVTWSEEVNKRVTKISWTYRDLAGGLDLSGCTALKQLDCSYSALTGLDLSNYTALQKLNCSFNALTSLNLSGCTALTELDCRGNSLSSLDLSSCAPVLEILYCAFNKMTSLELTGFPVLRELWCRENELTSLNLSCPSLQKLICDRNQLTALNLTGCPALMQSFAC